MVCFSLPEVTDYTQDLHNLFETATMAIPICPCMFMLRCNACMGGTSKFTLLKVLQYTCSTRGVCEEGEVVYCRQCW